MATRIKDGEVIGVLDLGLVGTVDWTDYTSASFTDSSTGLATTAGLNFASLTVFNQSVNDGFLKLRARTIAGAPTASELRAPGSTITEFGLRGVASAGTAVRTLAYRLGNAADTGVIVATFDRL